MMKKTSKLASVLVMGALLSLMPQPDAWAADPTAIINITATVVSRTCTFDEAVQSVALDEINTREFTDKGVKKSTTFSVAISCGSGVTSVGIVPVGTPDSQDPTAFANTGQSTGVALRLQDQTGNALWPDGSRKGIVTLVAGKGSYIFRAGYVATAPGAVTGGSFVSVMTLSFNYD